MMPTPATISDGPRIQGRPGVEPGNRLGAWVKPGDRLDAWVEPGDRLGAWGEPGDRLDAWGEPVDRLDAWVKPGDRLGAWVEPVDRLDARLEFWAPPPFAMLRALRIEVQCMISGQIARAFALAFACAGALSCGSPEPRPSGEPLPALPHSTAFRERTPKRYAFSVDDLPEPFATSSSRVDPVIRPNIHDAAVFVPPGFSVETFVTGLAGPRRAISLSNGDLIVSESFGLRISLLRDTTGDGRPDRRFTLVQGQSRPYGIALHGDHLYMGFEDHILRARYREGSLRLEGELESLAAIPSGGHWTRDVAVSPDGSKLFVSVGSRSNFNKNSNEPARRAVILEMNLDGSAERVFASGLRNPVSLLFHPTTGTLFATVSERDGLGDELPPDFLTSVRDGGFYGWPEAYIGPHVEPRLPAPDSARVAEAIVPDVLLQAHSSPMGMLLYDGSQFPDEYHGDLFLAFHGSYNRARRTGYKVVRVPMDEAGRPIAVNGVAGYEDFATGWSEDPASIEVWGRPAGVAQHVDGSLLILDDAAGRIWRITYRAPAR